ncbi:hypothetical protein C8R45DRAFT_938061 [Mycena sanguinolenta]|nr:hypothetical protein C8R45DRAFT_938061 [Mycena sanguinolenta]
MRLGNKLELAPAQIHQNPNQQAELLGTESNASALSTLRAGFLGIVWRAAMEDKPLVFWQTRISERRAAIHDLLLSFNRFVALIQYCVTQYTMERSRTTNGADQIPDGQCRGTGPEFRTNEHPTAQTRAEICAELSSLRQTPSEIERMLNNMSLHDVRDPVFFLLDPVGGRIIIQLSCCTDLNDFDYILKGYLSNHPEAGGRYARKRLVRELKPWVQLEMSIIKRMAKPPRTVQTCPQCGRVDVKGNLGSWVDCARYQVTEPAAQATEGATVPAVEETSSSQIPERKETEYYKFSGFSPPATQETQPNNHSLRELSPAKDQGLRLLQQCHNRVPSATSLQPMHEAQSQL